MSIDPITKTVTVPLPPDRAFKLFTEEMADWWPLDTHSMSAGDQRVAKTVKVSPQLGGEVTETHPDGREFIWGTVTDWTPGKAFGMTWHVGRPAEDASHVQVSFDVVADGTQVTLVHDNWAAMGKDAVALRAGYFTGWDMVFLDRYGTACRALKIQAQ